MAGGGDRRRGRGGGLDAWPGYVDALSTLLMVIIFVLLVFVLAQGFLAAAVSTRDRALERLNRQMSELGEMLALERGTTEELRASLARAQAEITAAGAARDTALSQLSLLREERDRLGTERDAARGERERLAARIADLETASRSRGDRVGALEQQLADARARAETVGGDAARTTRDLTEARRQLEALRAEATQLDTQVRADRATIEARLSDLSRLSDQVRALTALRDEMERQAEAAMARASAEEQRRQAAEREAEQRAEQSRAALARAQEEETRRRAAEQTAAQSAEQGQAAIAQATEADARRRAAEQAAEEARRVAAQRTEESQQYARLSESARAQAALLSRDLTALRAELSRIAAALEAAEAAGRDKDAQIVALGQRLNAALAARVEELQRYRSDFFGRLRDVLGDRPEIRVVGDRFVFQSEVLFPAASAELSPAGERQIRDIARVLQQITAQIPPDLSWVLRIDGHADRNPIRNARFASNWELSAARSIAVAQLLINEGLPANRVAAAAFGDTQPLDTADTPEALARNRRIELRLTDR
ncbi:MAG TPA: peptidoglycan -binding protein [Roseomonas sp.]|jgi:chemotaxis protein MotB